MRNFYFLFTVNLNKELKLYSFNPRITILGSVINRKIGRHIGTYNGKALSINSHLSIKFGKRNV